MQYIMRTSMRGNFSNTNEFVLEKALKTSETIANKLTNITDRFIIIAKIIHLLKLSKISC